jgi:hypothetical protein
MVKLTNNVQLARFCTYCFRLNIINKNQNILILVFSLNLNSFWIIRKGAESFSVHGQSHRTNNVKSLNKLFWYNIQTLGYF